MCFDWTCYLELAKELKTQASGSTNKEAKLRSSISRAYYASYCHSRNFLITNEDYHDISATPHKALIQEFKSKDIKHRTIGDLLDKLKNFRIKADYRDDFRKLEKKVETAIEYADYLMEKLSEIDTN